MVHVRTRMRVLTCAHVHACVRAYMHAFARLCALHATVPASRFRCVLPSCAETVAPICISVHCRMHIRAVSHAEGGQPWVAKYAHTCCSRVVHAQGQNCGAAAVPRGVLRRGGPQRSRKSLAAPRFLEGWCCVAVLLCLCCCVMRAWACAAGSCWTVRLLRLLLEHHYLAAC